MFPFHTIVPQHYRFLVSPTRLKNFTSIRTIPCTYLDIYVSSIIRSHPPPPSHVLVEPCLSEKFLSFYNPRTWYTLRPAWPDWKYQTRRPFWNSTLKRWENMNGIPRTLPCYSVPRVRMLPWRKYLRSLFPEVIFQNLNPEVGVPSKERLAPPFPTADLAPSLHYKTIFTPTPVRRARPVYGIPGLP